MTAAGYQWCLSSYSSSSNKVDWERTYRLKLYAPSLLSLTSIFKALKPPKSYLGGGNALRNLAKRSGLFLASNSSFFLLFNSRSAARSYLTSLPLSTASAIPAHLRAIASGLGQRPVSSFEYSSKPSKVISIVPVRGRTLNKPDSAYSVTHSPVMCPGSN